jgi:hypothetical protein
VKDDKLEIRASHSTPWFFKHLRGSAIPIRIGSDIMVLTHYVEYTQPRKYYHCIVTLDGEDYSPIRMTMPFTFKATGIEYCLGWKIENSDITFAFSSWDDNPCLTTTPISRFEWMNL